MRPALSAVFYIFYFFYRRLVHWHKKELFKMQREVDTHINVSLSSDSRVESIKWSCRNCSRLKVYHTTHGNAAGRLDFQFRYVFTHATFMVARSTHPQAHTRGASYFPERAFVFPFTLGALLLLWFVLLVKFISSADESVGTEKFSSDIGSPPVSRGGWIIQQLVCRRRWITHMHSLRADFADSFRFVRTHTHTSATCTSFRSSARADLVFF